jgi:hypothetical protein
MDKSVVPVVATEVVEERQLEYGPNDDAALLREPLLSTHTDIHVEPGRLFMLRLLLYGPGLSCKQAWNFALSQHVLVVNCDRLNLPGF